MHEVFISYRREDSTAQAQQIWSHLEKTVGAEHVFFDDRSIELGTDFRASIESALAGAIVLVAVIGPGWLGKISRNDQLEDEPDYVGLELRTALELDIPVIPVLIENAEIPIVSDLPNDLKDLAFRQAFRLLDLSEDSMARLCDFLVLMLWVAKENEKKNEEGEVDEQEESIVHWLDDEDMVPDGAWLKPLSNGWKIGAPNEVRSQGCLGWAFSVWFFLAALATCHGIVGCLSSDSRRDTIQALHTFGAGASNVLLLYIIGRILTSIVQITLRDGMLTIMQGYRRWGRSMRWTNVKTIRAHPEAFVLIERIQGMETMTRTVTIGEGLSPLRRLYLFRFLRRARSAVERDS